TGKRSVTLETVPLKPPSEGEVLIRVAYCAICTWEQRVYGGVYPTYPLLGGHEVSGVVEKVGPDVTHVRPGDKVIASGLSRCGYCDNCRRGFSNRCENQFSQKPSPDRPIGPGGLAEFIMRKSDEVFKLSPEASLEEAALGEPVACVLRSIKKANIQP